MIQKRVSMSIFNNFKQINIIIIKLQQNKYVDINHNIENIIRPLVLQN